MLTLLMLAVTTFAATGDKYELIFNGKNQVKFNGVEIDAASYLTWNSSKHNFNNKFTGCSYAGVDFTKGLKMEGVTLVQWTSTSASKVIIVQSDWSSNTIKFDDAELDVTSTEAITKGMVYTIEDVEPGTHKITRGSGETGLFYVSIEYTGEAKTQLDTPEITYDKATGIVTIGAVDNATDIRYTIDGTNPSSEVGEIYEAPFTVEDGTTVKAVAIGEGNFINSAIASALVLVDGVQVKAPVINQLNGTVYIKSETIGSSVEYSLDQQEWKNGDRAFTLFEAATVYARAIREGSITSEVVSAPIQVFAAPTNTEKMYFFYDNPDAYTVWADCNTNRMEGADYNYNYDYALEISGNAEKNWSGADPIIIPEIQVPGMKFAGDSVATLKLSNGAQNTITLPSDKKAVRITFYSYVNGPSTAATTASGWKEVNGVEYDFTDVPMCCFNDLTRTYQIEDKDEQGNPVMKDKTVKDMAGNADVRYFDLDFVEEKITFTNKGTQLCFVVVLDIATDETVTGISAVKTIANVENNELYNIAGQRVANGYKGLVVKNGKKMIQK